MAVRIVSWRLLALLLLAILASTVLVNQVLFPGRVWEPLFARSAGLVHPNLLAGLLQLALGVGLVLFWVGGLRPRDVGWRAGDLRPALLAVLLLWAGTQLVLGSELLLRGGALRLAQGWAAPTRQLGRLLGQFLGNALNEETVFRGFLMVQAVGRARRRWSGAPRRALLLGLLGAAAVFALSHVPNRLMRGHYDTLGAVLSDQGMLLATGTLFGWMLLASRNLLLVVGVHALLNEPAPLLEPAGTALPLDACVLLLGAASCWVVGRLGERGATRG